MGQPVHTTNIVARDTSACCQAAGGYDPTTAVQPNPVLLDENVGFYLETRTCNNLDATFATNASCVTPVETYQLVFCKVTSSLLSTTWVCPLVKTMVCSTMCSILCLSAQPHKLLTRSAMREQHLTGCTSCLPHPSPAWCRNTSPSTATGRLFREPTPCSRSGLRAVWRRAGRLQYLRPQHFLLLPDSNRWQARARVLRHCIFGRLRPLADQNTHCDSDVHRYRRSCQYLQQNCLQEQGAQCMHGG